ncbi:MAG: iron transporter [Desulfobacteraceae bacterium IS3]|nr:MAG: iron transporter [Desulfobacteraceae bacterium IS3]
MENFKDKLKFALISGIRKGWSGFVWMMKILLPISFFTMLLDYSGLISRLDFLLSPVMGLLSLPPAAALPLIAGMLTGIYGGIAAMIMLPLSVDQMTLIAVFILISHNLIQEGIIQGQSGMHPFKATIFRLTASSLTVAAVAHFLDPVSAVPAVKNISASGAVSFWSVLEKWGMETAYLSFKIFLIIMALMTVLGIMKSFNGIPRIVRVLKPVLKLMGLDERVGLLWLTAGIFGIAYGAAVILEEAKEGNLTADELTRLHLSIGINHSMVEDPSLFLSLGLSAFWLWIPRLITAILAVHLMILWQKMRHRKSFGILRESVK